jgi:hypothetical protein
MREGFMKKILALLILFLLLLPSLSLAAEFKDTNLPKDETVSGDLYLANSDVTSAGNVNGDLVIAGGNVIVDGKVDKELLVAGGTVIIRGTIGSTIRAAAGNIIMEGECFGDFVVTGGQVDITSKAKIHRDLVVFAGMVNVLGSVEGKTNIQGGQILLNGSLSGDVKVNAGSLVIGKNTHIPGSLSYEASAPAQIDNGSKLGKVDYKQTEKPKYSITQTFSLGWILSLFGAIILALLLVYIFPQKSKQVVEKTAQKFWKSLGLGFLILVIVPLAAFVLMITMIGFLTAVIVILAYIALLIVASVYSGVILGGWLWKLINKNKDYELGWASVLIGVVLLRLITLIPFIGWLFGFVLLLLAIGGLTYFDFGLYKDMRKKKVF